MKHSSEPWLAAEDISNSKPGLLFVYSDTVHGNIALDVNLPDAQRIVACVNACQGIPNELLESSLSVAREWVKLRLAYDNYLAGYRT